MHWDFISYHWQLHFSISCVCVCGLHEDCFNQAIGDFKKVGPSQHDASAEKNQRAIQTVEYYGLAKNICYSIAFKFFIIANDRVKLNNFGQINLIETQRTNQLHAQVTKNKYAKR